MSTLVDMSQAPARKTRAQCRILLVATALLLAPFLASGQPTRDLQEASDPLAELREARRVVAEDPQEGRARLIRALGNVGAWTEAEPLARELLVSEPSTDHALLLAWILRRQERLEAAIDVLEEHLEPSTSVAADTAPGHAANDAARRELALLHLTGGAPARALEVLEAAQDPDPGVRGLVLAALPTREGQAAEALRSALDRPDTTVVPETDLVRELGTVLLEGGEAKAALPYLRTTSEEFPDAPDAAYRLALALRGLGETEQARSMIERFQTLREGADRRDTAQRTLGTQLNEAQELAQQNRLDEALRRVDGIVDAYPDSYSALALRAKIQFSQGRGSTALDDIRRASRLAPGITEFHYLEGLFERTSGNNEPAREALLRALALDPELVEAHALMGGIELELGNPQAALEHLETAVRLGATGAQIERAIEIARQRVEASP